MKVISICFLLIVVYSGFAQTKLIDSLKNELKLANSPRDQLTIYEHLVRQAYKEGENGLVETYIAEGLILADEAVYPVEKAALIFQKGVLLESNNKEEAIVQFKRVLELLEQVNQVQKSIPAYIHLVSNYADLQQNDLALAYYEKVNSIIESDDWEHRAWSNSVIARLYFYGEEYAAALRHYQLALQQYQQINYESGIGSTLMDIGNIFYSENQPDSALIYYQASLVYVAASNHPIQEAITYYNIGDTYTLKKDYLAAIVYFKKSEKVCRKLADKSILSYALIGQAQAYTALGKYDLAIQQAKECIALGKASAEIGSQELGLMTLIDIYKQKRDFQKALVVTDSLQVLKDKLKTTENQRIVEELEQQYQAKEKQAQIDLQNSQLGRQRLLLIATLLIAALLLGLAFLAFRIAQQRQKINLKLRQLDQTKSNFFANVSHELRTPLTLIIAPLENVIKKTKNQTQKEDLELAHSNSQKLLNLVNEILDLSKLEDGKMQVSTKPVQLQILLRRTLFAFESLAKLRGISLHFENEIATDVWVELDISKVEKIINNLLSNALKYASNGDRITLAAKANQQLVIAIEDTGKGIPKTDLPRIFDRFYQSEQNTQQLQGGTGIGLALAREYARLLKGDLTVESEVGKGTIFYLQLPLVKTEALEMTRKTSEAIVEKEIAVTTFQPQVLFADKPKILVVEDNLEMSQFLVKTLSPYYRCTTALNGIEGLEKLAKNRFDLITSDVMMPEMDGFTFLQKVHERELFSHTPVIMLTARSLETDKLQGLQLGVDDYITKPFSTNELLARIDNLLKNKQEREEWQRAIKKDATAETPSLTAEQTLLKEAEALIIEQLSNSDFKVGDLAKALNYSQRQLERIIKKLTGLSPLNFIKEIRLQQARQLLESRQFSTVAEVGYEVGFADPGYFSKVYQKRFGKRPSEVV